MRTPLPALLTLTLRASVAAPAAPPRQPLLSTPEVPRFGALRVHRAFVEARGSPGGVVELEVRVNDGIRPDRQVGAEERSGDVLSAQSRLAPACRGDAVCR